MFETSSSTHRSLFLSECIKAEPNHGSGISCCQTAGGQTSAVVGATTAAAEPATTRRNNRVRFTQASGMKSDGANCTVCLCVASHRWKGVAVAADQWRCEGCIGSTRGRLCCGRRASSCWCYQISSVMALQEASEVYLVGMFVDTNSRTSSWLVAFGVNVLFLHLAKL